MKPTSFVLAYAIGVLLTLVVVAFSAWRVSRMNIVAAIRNLPEDATEKKRRRRWVLGIVGLLVGVALASSGVSSKDAVVLGLGVSIVILSLVPILRVFLPVRAVRTVAGLMLIAWFLLPFDRWILGQPKVNFGIFVLGGLMIVVGASWTLMYNADVLLGTLGAATSANARASARPEDVDGVSASKPVPDRRHARDVHARRLHAGRRSDDERRVRERLQRQRRVRRRVRRAGDGLARGADHRHDIGRRPRTRTPAGRLPGSREHLDARGQGPPARHDRKGSLVRRPRRRRRLPAEHDLQARRLGARLFVAEAVWSAVRTRPNLAVVDQFVVPRRENWTFGMAPDFKLKGFYLEDKTFDPVRVAVRDQQTGKRLVLRVVGVLSDSTPEFMGGMWTSQRSVGSTFGDRVLPTTYLFALRPGLDAEATAAKIESEFLANGVEADSLAKLLSDTVAANRTMNRLVMGFMGLGLIVGVAALGVISARSVVERRQQIGVLRAIGFRKRMVQLAFLLESSFVALSAIVVGTGLGLVVAHNVIDNARRQPSWQNLGFDVPWGSLGVIFLLVYLVALATTLAPAVRASRIYPAEALRYQ